MSKEKNIVCTVFTCIIGVMLACGGMVNAIIYSYARPLINSKYTATAGFYEELPDETEYCAPDFGIYSKLVKGGNAEELNRLCQEEIIDDIWDMYAYDAENMFESSIGKKQGIAYFADKNAQKYLAQALTGGNAINEYEGEYIPVWMGGSGNKKTKVGDVVSVTVVGTNGLEYDYDNCVVVGKIDAEIALPADVNFTAKNYCLQRESLIILPYQFKEINIFSNEKYCLLKLHHKANAPEGYESRFGALEENGYEVLDKENEDIQALSTAYYTVTITKETLLNFQPYKSQISMLLYYSVEMAMAVVLGLKLGKGVKGLPKQKKLANYGFFAAGLVAVSFVAIIILKYTSGLVYANIGAALRDCAIGLLFMLSAMAIYEVVSRRKYIKYRMFEEKNDVNK